MEQQYNKFKLIPILFLSILLTSCLEKSVDRDGEPKKVEAGDTVYITLTAAESNRAGRYLGTYQEVDGVVLNYHRSDGIGDNQSVELQLVASNYGAATTTMEWTGAIENVIPGARYDFNAKAYTNGMKCWYNFWDNVTETYVNNPDYVEAGCQNLRQAEPRENMDLWPSAANNWNYAGVYKANLFEGDKAYFKLETGNNDLQLRMSPILRPSADGQMIPYISKIERAQSYAPKDNLTLNVEFKGPEGFIIGLLGTVTGTCSLAEESSGGCVSINETFLANQQGEDSIMRLCNSENAAWWASECDFSENIITKTREVVYKIPDNPPDQIRFEFIVRLKNTYTITGTSGNGEEYTYTSWDDSNLGLSNTIWFQMNRNSIDQTSELIFMPTVQDISVYYDMSSATADLSYALQTLGITDDIEIFANLVYGGSTPLGFPSPYLKLVNTGSDGSQTLYGRMDKNELYEANLQLNFVHTPTGFEYTSGYPLPANDKPKFGNMWGNWGIFQNTGQCEQCLLVALATKCNGDRGLGSTKSLYDEQGTCSSLQAEDRLTSGRPQELWDQGDERGYGAEIDGYRRFANYYTEFNTDKDPWTLNSPKIDGGSLAYSNLGGVIVYDGEPYDGISYLQILNTSFLGTNLSNLKFHYVNLSGSKFINSQINNTLFNRSKLDNTIFTSDDGLVTTQNLPYTDIKYDMSNGDNIKFYELTSKLKVTNSQFRNIEFNNNLVYQSNFDGVTLSGEFMGNDVVETSVENSNFSDVKMDGTSFISTSIALSNLKGADLSTTWFDSASGTDFYLVECDETTVLPVYQNISCRNNYLEFAEEANQEFVLDLPSDKNRASYLYSGDADSFKLLVENPASIAIEVTSKSGDIQFALRKSGDLTLIPPTSNDTRSVSRTDGNYTTRWAYYSDVPPLTEDEYYYVQVYGTTGVFYIIGYYQEE